MKTVIVLIALMVLFILFPCGCSKDKTSSSKQDGLERLADFMTGSFSSQEQAQTDTNYYDIRLHMVPIWLDREDGKWLYVEQAAVDSPEEPYRQRIYFLTQVNDTTYQSQVYYFNKPIHFAGEWRKEIPMADFSPDSLLERQGCAILLTEKEKNVFVGSTVGRNCVSNYHGATYATSSVIITENGLMTWDRGFNDNDEQVWGAVKGGYVFLRTNEM